MHLQDFVHLHYLARTISFSFCELDRYDFFFHFLKKNFLAVEEMHMRFDQKSVACSSSDGSSKK